MTSWLQLQFCLVWERCVLLTFMILSYKCSFVVVKVLNTFIHQIFSSWNGQKLSDSRSKIHVIKFLNLSAAKWGFFKIAKLAFHVHCNEVHGCTCKFSCYMYMFYKLLIYWIYIFLEPPKLVVNEKRYGRWSRPEASYSEDLYSADDESMIESRPESRLSDSHVTSEADRQDIPTREVRYWHQTALQFRT